IYTRRPRTSHMGGGKQLRGVTVTASLPEGRAFEASFGLSGSAAGGPKRSAPAAPPRVLPLSRRPARKTIRPEARDGICHPCPIEGAASPCRVAGTDLREG
ncbi:MAG: hypothetical protein N3A38_14660, partial [Planctomycetota bacterium]|nr:hypothetical protein [Planctomycetota bacterium]